METKYKNVLAYKTNHQASITALSPILQTTLINWNTLNIRLCFYLENHVVKVTGTY